MNGNSQREHTLIVLREHLKQVQDERTKLETDENSGAVIKRWRELCEDERLTKESVDTIARVPVMGQALQDSPTHQKKSKGGRPSKEELERRLEERRQRLLPKGNVIAHYKNNPIYQNPIKDIMLMDGFDTGDVTKVIERYYLKGVPTYVGIYVRHLHEKGSIERVGRDGLKYKYRSKRVKTIDLGISTEVDKQRFIEQVKQERELQKDLGAK